MSKEFELNQDQLLDIANNLKSKIIEGVNAHNQELQCFPTYIPIMQVPENGRALVVDFGGTQVQAAVVSLKESELCIEKGPVTTTIPIKGSIPLEQNAFLDSFAELIVSLNPPQDLPLGYCFSYPTDPMLDGDARLIKWTKELFVKDTVGENMGRLLMEHLAGYASPLHCSKVVVINDTVASLLAGLTVTGADGYISLIVDRGTNMAAIMEPDEIPKLPGDLNWKDPIPVNLESGNFYPPHLTEWDDLLDARSKNPGQQRFEKALSGVYLPPLLATVFPESTIDLSYGSKAVITLAYESPKANQRERKLAQQLITRSAGLVAASLAGIIAFLNMSRPRNSFCIITESSLFWGDPHYEHIIRTTLKPLLEAIGLSRIACKFVSVPNANFLGSAVAALF